MRHFKIQTIAGYEDVFCNEFVETNPKEYWFIRHDKPPLIFQKANVISKQEVPRTSDKAMQPYRDSAKSYAELLKSRQLKG